MGGHSNETEESYTPPVLIVGFRRFENLRNILNICVEGGASSIYVTLDGPRTSEEFENVAACKLILKEFNESFSGSLFQNESEVNRGAALSVLSGCDWIFSFEQFAIILEDDCIPSLDFFKFVSDSKIHLDQDSRNFLIGGTQFVPYEITENKWFLSDYPLIWGWATSRDKWLVLRNEIRVFNYRRFKVFKTPEFAFWESGAYRALSGFVDAWDIPLAHIMRLNGWKTILPGVNLVSNIGNDFAATHTFRKSPWLDLETVKYCPELEAPTNNPSANRWLKSNLYGISIRHLISTSLNRLLDMLNLNKKKLPPLLERWR